MIKLSTTSLSMPSTHYHWSVSSIRAISASMEELPLLPKQSINSKKSIDLYKCPCKDRYVIWSGLTPFKMIKEALMVLILLSPTTKEIAPFSSDAITQEVFLKGKS